MIYLRLSRHRDATLELHNEILEQDRRIESVVRHEIQADSIEDIIAP